MGQQTGSRPGRPEYLGRASRTVSLPGRRQRSAAYCETSRRGYTSTGQGQSRVPRLEQSTQLHTNPSHPPVHSRLLPRPPHCRTGPLPLATPLVCTVRKLPRIHPPSPSPCLLPPQASRVRLFGLSTTLFAACLSNPIVSCHPAPYSLFLFIPTSAFPPINTRPPLLLLPFRPRPVSARRSPSLSPPHHSTYTLFCPGSADGVGVHHLETEERGVDRARRRRPSITSLTPTIATATATALIARNPHSH